MKPFLVKLPEKTSFRSNSLEKFELGRFNSEAYSELHLIYLMVF